MLKNALCWLLSFFIAVSFAVFQRLTGPTYPLKGKFEISGKSVEYDLPRSCTISERCVLKMRSSADPGAYAVYKRYKTSDTPLKLEFKAREGLYPVGTRNAARLDAGMKAGLSPNPGSNALGEGSDGVYEAVLPDEPPAGKLAYQVFLRGDSGDAAVNPSPAVVRFKGPVPASILVPHVLFMFLFMFFSVKIFISGVSGFGPVKHAVIFNYLFLVFGGFIFGPLTQRYAFGEYWTGFPFGGDLTDNKTLIMLVFWTPALWAVLKKKNHKFWITLAFSVTALVYFIPHSLLGSELDYSKLPAGK